MKMIQMYTQRILYNISIGEEILCYFLEYVLLKL